MRTLCITRRFIWMKVKYSGPSFAFVEPSDYSSQREHGRSSRLLCKSGPALNKGRREPPPVEERFPRLRVSLQPYDLPSTGCYPLNIDVPMNIRTSFCDVLRWLVICGSRSLWDAPLVRGPDGDCIFKWVRPVGERNNTRPRGPGWPDGGRSPFVERPTELGIISRPFLQIHFREKYSSFLIQLLLWCERCL